MADALATQTKPGDPTLWVAMTAHTQHLLERAGERAILLEQCDAAAVGGRSLIIAPSAAKPGMERAAAGKLHAMGAARVAVVSNLPNGALDLADHIETSANGRAVDLDEIAALAIVPTPPNVKMKKGASASAAERLVQLALELFEIGRTESDEAFAIRKSGPRIALMFRGSKDALRSTLAREYRLRYEATPRAAALVDALTTLQGEALESDPREVHLRVAPDGEKIVIDLGRTDGRAGVIGNAGWQEQDKSPVIFRRTALTAELPIPEHGGDLKMLRELLNVNDEGWRLLLGWLIAALVPGIPHPVLMLGGQQGAGKSTTARVLGNIIDPSPAPLRSQPNDVEAWAMAASGSWLVAVDNISSITGWWSDALCRAVTGDGWIRRKLFTDSELSVLSFRRVVILTSIDAGALRGDLGDRLLLLDLEPISPEKRRSEVELDRMLATSRARILGALLTELSAVLKVLPLVKLASLPRMADFARILAALDGLHGTKSLHGYLGQRGRVAEDVLEADPVGAAVRELADWQGTAGDLLKHITQEGSRPKDWPANPRALVARLKRLVPALRQVGTEIVFHHERSNKGRLIGIRKRLSQLSQPSLSEGKVSDGPVTVGGFGDGREIVSTVVPHSESDGSDDSDGLSPTLNTMGADAAQDGEIF